MRILCNASIQLCAIHLVSNLKWNPKTSYHKYGQLSSLPFTAAHRKLEKRVYNLSASAAHPSIFTTCASITCARMSGQDNCHCSRVALGKYIHTPCGGEGVGDVGSTWDILLLWRVQSVSTNTQQRTRIDKMVLLWPFSYSKLRCTTAFSNLAHNIRIVWRNESGNLGQKCGLRIRYCCILLDTFERR